MAEYTNLTTLDKLAVGDTITYDTTTAIDFKGAVVKVELYGVSNNPNNSYGGYTTFIIDTSLLPSTILSFNNDYTVSGVNVSRRNDLIYGDTTDIYYRIAVAGNSGSGPEKSGSGTAYLGKGGGLEGGRSSNNYSSNMTVTGGSQTSGGTCNSSATGSKYNGSFGSGNTTRYNSGFIGAWGGYGWYGGGSGAFRTSISSIQYLTGGSGGSGFIIGTSTTTYPSGYLGDDTDLQTLIASSITEGTLTNGGSKNTTPTMVLTLLKVSDTSSKLNYYNGTSFIKTNINYYNGTEFIPCNAYRFNGNEFIKL